MSSTISYKVVIYILTIDKLHKECIIAYNLAIVLMLYGSIEYCVGNARKKKNCMHTIYSNPSLDDLLSPTDNSHPQQFQLFWI